MDYAVVANSEPDIDVCADGGTLAAQVARNAENMVTRLPFWLCGNAWGFAEQKDDLPADQHVLLPRVTPRPVYVHSGTEDTWGDGRGEYLSVYHAIEVYWLLGKKGLEAESSPAPNSPILDGSVGYHIREGGHSIEPQDWTTLMDLADRHLKN